jgi:hypothetical protein
MGGGGRSHSRTGLQRSNSLVTGKRTGMLVPRGDPSPSAGTKSAVVTVTYGQIPYTEEQGNSEDRSGKSRGRSGISQGLPAHLETTPRRARARPTSGNGPCPELCSSTPRACIHPKFAGPSSEVQRTVCLAQLRASECDDPVSFLASISSRWRLRVATLSRRHT